MGPYWTETEPLPLSACRLRGRSPGSASQRLPKQAAPAGRGLALERRLERDLVDAGERAGDHAGLLGRLGGLLEGVLVDAGHAAGALERDPGDRRAGVLEVAQRHAGLRLERLRLVAVLPEHERER